MESSHLSSHGSAPVISLSNVSYIHDGQTVLDDITLEIEEGSYTGIIGPNGGGKTTLLKIIVGLFPQTKGTVRVCGLSPREATRKSLIGYVPQRIAQGTVSFPATVQEIVESGRASRVGLFKTYSETDRKIIDDSMDRTGISHLRNRLIDSLSGGERQKVFIARALAAEPKILILDEPTTGVDITSKEEFFALLQKLNKDMHITIIFVSHDMEVITKEAKSVVCLNQKLLCHCSAHKALHDETLKSLYGEHFSVMQHTH